MPDVSDYLHALADDIGPRPATTDTEAQAAEYLETVFEGRGLPVEQQQFVCPRTYSWAYVVYHVLTIAAVGAAFFELLVWPAFALAAIVAVVLWRDLDTRFGLSALMPKGPSQNVIARYVPKARRGERLKRVIVVAHYDSAKASLAFAPALVKNFAATFGLMKACTFLVPVFLLLHALPVAEVLDPWVWYASVAAAAYLLVPLFINVHRELAMSAVDGANDNASGVAAMLGVLDRIVPEGDGAGASARRSSWATGDLSATGPMEPLDVDDGEAGGLLEYSPAGTALPDDFEWAEPDGAPDARSESRGRPDSSQAMLEFDTIEFDAVGTGDVRGSAEEAADHRRFDELEGEPPRAKPPHAERQRDPGVAGWLGLGKDFDPRKKGREIGSWENFDDEGDDEDGFGFKGGAAGGDFLGDPDYVADEVSRIRRRVTERADRDLIEKEIWFVATGAEEAGTWGMKAFLDEYGDEARDALIINIDNVGAGTLHWITAEGMARRYRSDRKLVSLARRVSRENGIVVKPRVYKGLSTDATPALARGYRAMSVMAFDINGRLPNWHWHTDTTDNVQADLVERAAEFVVALIREM